MPIDALYLSGLVQEFTEIAQGAKLEKIYQPHREDLLLTLRTQSHGSVKLLLSAHPSHPRPQFTQISRENPETPPMFCMLLRKHLTGARILRFEQPSMERVLIILLDAVNDLGDHVQRSLVLESISHRSNLILLDENHRILDCIRRVESKLGQENASRNLLPGLFYHLPPPQEKEDPSTLDTAQWQQVLQSIPPNSSISTWLLNHFRGLSPLLSRELALLGGGSVDALGSHLTALGIQTLLQVLVPLFDPHTPNRPYLLTKEGVPCDIAPIPIHQYEPHILSSPHSSFSQVLDIFYGTKEQSDRLQQKSHSLIQTIQRARDRLARKIPLQEQELQSTRNRDRLREFGDLITSQLHTMERGMTTLHTVDFYDPQGLEVDIPLQPLLTPQQNAAKYYKEYTKAKTREAMLTRQLEQGRQELEYLNSVLDLIPMAESERDILEVRQEMIQGGYLGRDSKGKKGGKPVVSKPMEFRSSSGLRISVGKNNTQNDRLTCKQARNYDLWFHTQRIHGSHVILWTEGQSPDPQSIQEAACLAAWFSQARGGGKIPVDYTPVKYVKKPHGSPPGKVIYTTYETAWVSPTPQMIEQLQRLAASL